MEFIIKVECDSMNIGESVEYSTDNITTVESTMVKEEVKEEHAETEDPLIKTGIRSYAYFQRLNMKYVKEI